MTLQVAEDLLNETFLNVYNQGEVMFVWGEGVKCKRIECEWGF